MQTSAAAPTLFDAAPSLTHFFHLSAPPLFAAYKLCELGVLERRDLQIDFALYDQFARRRISRHRFYRIDLREIARQIESFNFRRNTTAVNHLFTTGFWKQTETGIRPARALGDLMIDDRQITAIQTWMRENKVGRRTVLIPRHLFEELPRYSRGQFALALELIRRVRHWEGDASETSATVSLPIPQIASCWGIGERTLQYALNETGLGASVRFEPIDRPWYELQVYGGKFRVIIAPPNVVHEPVPKNTTPVQISTSIPHIVHKCTLEKSAQLFAPPPPMSAQLFAPPDLALNPRFQRALATILKKAPTPVPNPRAGCDQPTSVEDSAPTAVVDHVDDNLTTLVTRPQRQGAGGYASNQIENPEVPTAAVSQITPLSTALVIQTQRPGYQVGEKAEDSDQVPTNVLDLIEASAEVEVVDPALTPPVPVIGEIERPGGVDPGDETTALLSLARAPSGASPGGTAAAPALAPAVPPAATPAVAVRIVDGLPPPRWDNLIPADLSDVGRLDAIYEQVIARGVINRSQSRRLDFVGAAVRARSVGANPPAVFRTLVTTNLWDHITDSQEDIARDMIRRHDHRLPAFLATAPRPPSPPPLSHDAEIVGTVRRWLRSEQYQGDFFHAFKRLDEGESWTRDRWDVASQELDAKEH